MMTSLFRARQWAAVSAALIGQPRLTHSQVRDSALHVLKTLLPAQRRFEVELWDGTLLPATQPPALARIVLHTRHALGWMLQFPLDVALGEAYLRGDFEIEGDIGAVTALGDDIEFRPDLLPSIMQDVLVLRRVAGPRPAPPEFMASLSGATHSRERDQQAIEHHYNVSNDFYRLWLDQRMVYSCAYFPTGTETLDGAQQAKLDYICRKLQLQPGQTLLDIGCGWGGLAIYAAQHFGVHVLGVTLSSAQLEEGQRRVRQAGLQDQVQLELRDYRDVVATGQLFDAISSVGMAEHVGRGNMLTYFQSAYQALKPGGLMLNHAIARGRDSSALPGWVEGGNFAGKYVFPDGELLPVWESLKYAAEAQFEVRDVENLREHYAQTLSYWLKNLEARRDEARALLGAPRYRLWRLYLGACIPSFQKGYLQLFQSLLAKPDEQRQVHLPPSRAGLYA